jgi:hypothetical protein
MRASSSSGKFTSVMNFTFMPTRSEALEAMEKHRELHSVIVTSHPSSEVFQSIYWNSGTISAENRGTTRALLISTTVITPNSWLELGRLLQIGNMEYGAFSIISKHVSRFFS